ncbi:MAG: hypothetical protein IJB09_00055 [Oscillospiraceae bacterium]|nr:hypothetical protein [Oscillospiraceae bacterium]
MNNIFAVLFGVVWGAAAAFANSRIARKALEKKDIKAAKNARRVQMLVDIAALVVLVLLRNILPFPYEISLVSAIIALSVLTIVFLFAMGKTKK